MKFFVAALAALVALPLGAALGYVAHRDPAPPPFDAYVQKQLALVPQGPVDDTWQAVPLSGPYKSQPVDAAQIAIALGSKKAVEQAAQGKVIYVESKCQTYSTTKSLTDSPVLVRKCSQTRRTFKQVMDYALGLLAPPAKS